MKEKYITRIFYRIFGFFLVSMIFAYYKGFNFFYFLSGLSTMISLFMLKYNLIGLRKFWLYHLVFFIIYMSLMFLFYI